MLRQNNSVAYYEGNAGLYNYCKINNLRSVIQHKQISVGHLTGNPSETIIIIYPGAQSTYKNFMDVLDEIQINDVKHYYIMN